MASVSSNPLWVIMSYSNLHWSLQCFLDVHALAHDGLVQFALKRQQIHVGLRLRDQLADLLREDNITLKSSGGQQ